MLLVVVPGTRYERCLGAKANGQISDLRKIEKEISTGACLGFGRRESAHIKDVIVPGRDK